MQLTGLGLGMLGDLEEVAKGGMAGVVTATGPLGARGWGSARGALGGFGDQGFLVLPPLLEKFIVFSALCFCFSCCLLLL